MLLCDEIEDVKIVLKYNNMKHWLILELTDEAKND